MFGGVDNDPSHENFQDTVNQMNKSSSNNVLLKNIKHIGVRFDMRAQNSIDSEDKSTLLLI